MGIRKCVRCRGVIGRQRRGVDSRYDIKLYEVAVEDLGGHLLKLDLAKGKGKVHDVNTKNLRAATELRLTNDFLGSSSTSAFFPFVTTGT